MTRGAWIDTGFAKSAVAVLVAVALVGLGIALPWSSGARAQPSITTDNRSLSVNFNWTSHPSGAPDYAFANESVTSDFARVGSSVASSLTMVVQGWVDGDLPGWEGGFAVSITGDVVPGLDPTGLRFVLVESANSTLLPSILLLPNGAEANVSDVDTAWLAQGNNGSTTQSGGPGAVAFQVDLQNQTGSPLPGGAPRYQFELSLGTLLQFAAFANGQTTYSFFAILQGLSQPVYCAMTIQVQQILL